MEEEYMDEIPEVIEFVESEIDEEIVVEDDHEKEGEDISE